MGNSTHATALREGEPQAKTDRQSATAKADKSERAYENAHQFPMGKVKGGAQKTSLCYGYVSIPYGKGKVD